MYRYSVVLWSKRGTDMASIRSVDYVDQTTTKEFERPLNYKLLSGTHIPEEYQRDAGALCALLLEAVKMYSLTVWLPEHQEFWIADAALPRSRVFRGSGKTPVEALLSLVRELYAY